MSVFCQKTERVQVSFERYQTSVSFRVPCGHEDSARQTLVSFCVLRQVVCAAAGRVVAERGEQRGLCQQPTEWGPHLGCTLLGVPLAVPAGNPGGPDLHSHRSYYGAGQVTSSAANSILCGF